MNLAVIPARGGSKRIPRKNIKNFAGLPIIAWSIRTALESECFDRVLVSTDDEEIAEVATQFGAEAPFLRPANLSDDHTTTVPVIAHAINWQQQNAIRPDYVCCIYATSPLILASDIKLGLQIAKQTNASYAFSVTSYGFPIQRALRLTTEKRLEMLHPEYLNTRSQDLEEVWHDAGQFYWGKTKAWLDEQPIFSADSVPVPLPRYRVQDIDTPEDWARAEWMRRALNQVDV